MMITKILAPYSSSTFSSSNPKQQQQQHPKEERNMPLNWFSLRIPTIKDVLNGSDDELVACSRPASSLSTSNGSLAT